MLWLNVIELDGRPHAFMYFGENVTDDAYHMPEKIAGAELWRQTDDGQRAKLETRPLDSTGRIGRIAPLPGAGPCVLEVSRQYGNYHGMLLTYYAKHIRAANPKEINAAGPSKELKLDVVPQINGGELKLTVLHGGKPLEESPLTVTVGDAEPVEHKTNADGTVIVRPERDGMVSVLASYRDAAVKGEIDSQPYTGAASFVTLTFHWSSNYDGREGLKPRATSSSTTPDAPGLPSLPEPLASFGAALADGWLYVYGGHIGEPHAHSAANLSKHFRRLRLADGREWEDLPMQTPVQGLAMVAHGGRIYRIGGMNARNATTEQEADLHSTDEYARFDPATGWSPLVPLPVARSSHDAAVIGNSVYVVGGWKLSGPGAGEWLDDALAFDFAHPELGWKKLPALPQRRRALAAGEWQGKLVAMGGIDEDGATSQRVDIFDPATGTWTEGPSLPEGDLAGFGASACTEDGTLYVSGLPGVLYRLSEDGQKWEVAARLKTPRFFHRLVAGRRPNSILAVGGAAEDGHVADIELIQIASPD
jgi:hypothetical protein